MVATNRRARPWSPGATGYIGRAARAGAAAQAGEAPAACWPATRARRATWPTRAARSSPATCCGARRWPSPGGHRASPTTWCTRWDAGARATSPSATARAPRTSRRPLRGGRRADRLPGRPLRRRLQAPREPPRDRRLPGIDRGAGHLLAGRGGDRLRQRVVPHGLLPGQAPAGDDHAALDHDPNPADRDRRRDRLPGQARENEAARAARSRSAGPTSPPTAA